MNDWKGYRYRCGECGNEQRRHDLMWRFAAFCATCRRVASWTRLRSETDNREV